MVVHAPQVVVSHGGERSVQGQYLESVRGKVELSDDFGAKEAHNVRSDAETKAREHLFGHRSASEHVAALEDKGRDTGAGEIGRGGKAIVTAADDDGVVSLRRAVPFLGGRILYSRSAGATRSVWHGRPR
jgi:hypothetical protein